MNVIINKTFNKVMLQEYLNIIMKPDSSVFSAPFDIYGNLESNVSIIDGKLAPVLFVPESFLNVITRINDKLFNDDLSLTSPDSENHSEWEVRPDLVVNTLINESNSERNSALMYLKGQNLCTDEEEIEIRNIVSTLKGFNRESFNRTYDDVEDVYSYTFETPTELTNSYDSEADNPNNSKLYLFFPAFLPKIFSDFKNGELFNSGPFSAFNKFFNSTTEKNVPQAGFIATELGDATSTTSDIKYDHLDKIEYLDSFRLRFKLPRVIS